MSLDITPVTPEGRQVIQKYGGGGFKIAGLAFKSSVLVRAEKTIVWPLVEASEITLDSLEPVLEGDADSGILLIGCGPRFIAPPKRLRQALKDRGVALEWMDTGAACRTFNVLLTEERLAVAALIAVD